jgi:hypothetical protein
MSGFVAARPRRLSCLLFVLCSTLSAGALAVDRIELKDGSVVLGDLKDADGGKIILATRFAGDIEIDQSEILAMDVDSQLVLQMEDGSVVEASKLRVANEQLLVEGGARPSYALNDLTRINPEPWELGDGYHFTGLASISANSQTGNTEREELA